LLHERGGFAFRSLKGSKPDRLLVKAGELAEWIGLKGRTAFIKKA